MPWNPGPDPYPDRPVSRITHFQYQGELKFVRHAKVHVNKVPKSLWQLADDFGAAMTIHLEDGAQQDITITAPRGMFTDLASVPEELWSIMGPIGAHLEASIVHDFLYMAWTSYRTESQARPMDWDFADLLFLEGMVKSEVPWFKRNLAHQTVRLVGWDVFSDKTYSLKTRMNQWLPLLSAGHGRD